MICRVDFVRFVMIRSTIPRPGFVFTVVPRFTGLRAVDGTVETIAVITASSRLQETTTMTEATKDKISHRIARHLPRRIIYWCAIVVGAHATQGKWSDQIVPDLHFMEALERWGDNNDDK